MKEASLPFLAVLGLLSVTACNTTKSAPIAGDGMGPAPSGEEEDNGSSAETAQNAAVTDGTPSTADKVAPDAGVTVPTTFRGRTLTVSKDGKGQYKTIQAGADAAQPGDGVVVGAGTYAENLRLRTSGTAEKPITITIAPGATVIIDGGKTLPATGNGLVNLDGVSNVQLIGLQVSNSKNFGFYGTNVKNVSIRGGQVSYSQDGSIVLGDGSNVVVDGVDVGNSNSRGLSADHESISIINVDGFEVKNCHVHDGKEEGIDAKYESRNGKIHGNHVEANNGPNIYVDAAHDIEIFDNIVHGARGTSKAGIALAVEDYSKTRKLYGVKIYNNVVFDNPAGMTLWRESTGSFSDVTIVNNTFYRNKNSAGGGIVNVGITAAGLSGTNVIRNNIFWENSAGRREIDDDGGAIGKFTVDHNLFKTGATASTTGANAVMTANPGFVDLAAGNVNLVAGSPAIDSGVATLAPTKDCAGHARPSGSGVDLGAFEL